jgi:hypothetical protein
MSRRSFAPKRIRLNTAERGMVAIALRDMPDFVGLFCAVEPLPEQVTVVESWLTVDVEGEEIEVPLVLPKVLQKDDVLCVPPFRFSQIAYGYLATQAPALARGVALLRSEEQATLFEESASWEL